MIKLFEVAEQSDIVINLAELAINVAEKTEHPDLVRLTISRVSFQHSYVILTC